MWRKREFADLAEHVLGVRIARKGRVGPLLEIDYLERFFTEYPVDCVFDVGANIGQYATRLRKKFNFRGAIISIEPSPEAADQLRKIAKGDNNWFVEELALDEEIRDAVFHVMEGSQFSSLLKPSHKDTKTFVEKNKIKQEIHIKTEKLDNLYKKYRDKLDFICPFIKMDTQGNDIRVVKGGISCIRDFFGLQSELSFKRIYEDAVDYRAALDFYHSLGFELGALVPNNEGHFPRLIELDCIMFNQQYFDGDGYIGRR